MRQLGSTFPMRRIVLYGLDWGIDAVLAFVMNAVAAGGVGDCGRCLMILFGNTLSPINVLCYHISKACAVHS